MKPFAFDLGQRVNVPNWNDVQGMVTLPTGQSNYTGTVKPGEHLFYLTWIDARGQPIDGWFSESELLEANAPPDVVGELARALEDAVRTTGVATFDNTTISLGRKSKRKKPARKTKSKSKKRKK